MMRAPWVSVLAVCVVSSLVACSAAETLLAPADVAGSYRLVSVYGNPLPAQSFPGRVTVDSGFLELSLSGAVRSDAYGYWCLAGDCGPFHTQLDGLWSLVGRNRLVMSYSTGATDSTYFARPGYVISTYLDGSRTLEGMRWNKN